jgi:acetamidase/formamidase
VLDRPRKCWRLPWGQEVPLAPFFGVMGTAPPPAWGMISTAPPRRNGGNLDNKELVAGTTLYLPIFVEGALFSVGDGHGVQGDGEVCVTAVETGLTGTFRLTVRDDMRLQWPMAETSTHVITMAFDPDLDDCVVMALRQMLSDLRARGARPLPGLYPGESRRRPAGDAGGQRQQGRPRDAREALSEQIA